MRISVDQAREYFAHPSQQLFGITPDTLPDDPFEYWASGPVCAIAHLAPHPGIWMAHIAVKPDGWGSAVPYAQWLLDEFWEEKKPERIIGWTPSRLRAAIAFARRVGFVEDGRMPMLNGELIMSGWAKHGH